MFEIRTEYADRIVNDKSIRLPRFQRKKSWDTKKRFELCMSLYKDYPLGTMVVKVDMVNKKPVKWLLDGRQRWDTIKDCQNPENIYSWAYTYLGLKPKMNSEQVEELFWQKVWDFIEQEENVTDKEISYEDPEIEYEGQDDIDNNYFEEMIKSKDKEEIISTMEIAKGNDHINDLLDIILTVHPAKMKGRGIENRTVVKSNFSEPFLFKNFKPSYVQKDPEDNNLYVDSSKLVDWIKGKLSLTSVDELDSETFASWFDNPESDLINQVEKKWDKIKRSLSVIEGINDRLSSAKICMLELQSDCTNADAKKIFEIINTKATPLTAAEILSAKPNWNKVVENPRELIVNNKNELYRRISGIENTGVVRWDVAATFTDRIDPSLSFILGDWKDPESIERKITIGFKLLSGYYNGAISKNDVGTLADRELTDVDEECSDSWNSAMLEHSISRMGKILLSDNFFKYVCNWRESLISLTSDAVALNYFILVLKDWKAKGEPQQQGQLRRLFLKNAKVLYDKSIYEYALGQWKGSSDSRISRNIKETFSSTSQFSQVEIKQWNDLLESLINENKIDGVVAESGRMRALLYYYYMLSGKGYPNDPLMSGIDIDHIIPKSRFFENTDEYRYFDSIINKAILPKKDNIKKSDSLLSNIKDDWLIKQIKEYEDIEKSEFENYSSSAGIFNLKEKRGKIIMEVLSNSRLRLITEDSN